MKLITCSFNYSVTFVFLSSLIFKLLTTNSTLCLKFTPALFFGALLFKFQNFKTFQRYWLYTLKVMYASFLLVCFMSKRENLWNKKKCFLFHFESSFHWDNQILNFQIFNCHDVIKCLSMKHKTHFIE